MTRSCPHRCRDTVMVIVDEAEESSRSVHVTKDRFSTDPPIGTSNPSPGATAQTGGQP